MALKKEWVYSPTCDELEVCLLDLIQKNVHRDAMLCICKIFKEAGEEYRTSIRGSLGDLYVRYADGTIGPEDPYTICKNDTEFSADGETPFHALKKLLELF